MSNRTLSFVYLSASWLQHGLFYCCSQVEIIYSSFRKVLRIEGRMSAAKCLVPEENQSAHNLRYNT